MTGQLVYTSGVHRYVIAKAMTETPRIDITLVRALLRA